MPLVALTLIGRPVILALEYVPSIIHYLQYAPVSLSSSGSMSTENPRRPNHALHPGSRPQAHASGRQGKLALGRHIHLDKGTPLANLWLSQLHALGIKQERFADSTGMVKSILKS